MVFKVLFLCFLDIVVFYINYALKPYSKPVFTLHSLCQYIVVF